MSMALTAGQKLAHYEILELIGSGGMGEVYRARDGKLGRDVAIKVLPEELARVADRLARFEREACLLAQLSHTNVATLYGLDEAEGCLFLAMELVEGEILAERIARGPARSRKRFRFSRCPSPPEPGLVFTRLSILLGRGNGRGL